MQLNKDDKLTVLADAHGIDAGDWGRLEVFEYEPHYIFKTRLIPFLWAMLFVFLIGKGHFYIALNSYIGFLLMLFAEKLNFGQLSFHDVLSYTIFYFLLAFVFAFIYQELRFLKKFKVATVISWIATLVVYFIPIIFIVFAVVFNKPMDGDALFAIYQTNPDEAKEYVETFIPAYYWVITIIFSLITGFFLWREEKKERPIIERSLLLLNIIVLAAIVSIEFINVRIPGLIYNSFSKYQANLDEFIEFQKKRQLSANKLLAQKEEKGELYVVVIGESLNKYNMGLYGYFRKTTPNLSNKRETDDLLVFSNVYSNSSNTMNSLSFALTEANQYNCKRYFQSPSFIEIFNAAKFDTFWLSRQGSLLDTNVVSAIARTAKHPIDLVNEIDLNSDDFYSFEDAKVLKSLKKNIRYHQKDKNTLIVVHIYGNHVHYQDRYPKSFQKYKNTPPYLIGTNAWYLSDYTAYDNSVYFNDYVISNLLKMVEEKGGVSSFMYFSDHSEDVVRHRGHTAQIGGFVYQMTQIPLIAWFSPEYKKRYPDTYKTFISHKDTLFSNDMIYDTLIGLAHIKTDHYNPIYDLSSPKYHLDPKNALTLHGRKHYTEPDNYIYWRKANTKILRDTEYFKKIVINDTDSVGKLNLAWQLGFRSFKLNLYYIDNKKYLQTGTDKYDTKGNVIKVFKFFNPNEVKHLFFNLTNLNKKNSKDTLERLKQIEKKLHIKERTILVIKQKSLVKLFKKNGWKIALDNKEGLGKQRNSNINYLVVNPEQYEQVQNNLSKHIVINHAFNLADSNLSKKLKKLKFMQDSKTDFLLIDFTSEYVW